MNNNLEQKIKEGLQKPKPNYDEKRIHTYQYEKDYRKLIE